MSGPGPYSPHDPGTAPRRHRLIGVKGSNPGLLPVEQAKVSAWATVWLRDTSAIVRILPHLGGAWWDCTFNGVTPETEETPDD
jgi:hypothetical protein